MANVQLCAVFQFLFFGLNALIRRLEGFRLDCLHASHIMRYTVESTTSGLSVVPQ